jgi:hypothetical protein
MILNLGDKTTNKNLKERRLQQGEWERREGRLKMICASVITLDDAWMEWGRMHDVSCPGSSSQ